MSSVPGSAGHQRQAPMPRSGFVLGFNSGRGGSSLRDRAIEGLIESVTPQATEEQRRIQRGAVRQATSINRESQRRAAEETRRATQDYMDSRSPPRSQGQPRSQSRSQAPRSQTQRSQSPRPQSQTPRAAAQPRSQTPRSQPPRSTNRRNANRVTLPMLVQDARGASLAVARWPSAGNPLGVGLAVLGAVSVLLLGGLAQIRTTAGVLAVIGAAMVWQLQSAPSLAGLGLAGTGLLPLLALAVLGLWFRFRPTARNTAILLFGALLFMQVLPPDARGLAPLPFLQTVVLLMGGVALAGMLLGARMYHWLLVGMAALVLGHAATLLARPDLVAPQNWSFPAVTQAAIHSLLTGFQNWASPASSWSTAAHAHFGPSQFVLWGLGVLGAAALVQLRGRLFPEAELPETPTHPPASARHPTPAEAAEAHRAEAERAAAAAWPKPPQSPADAVAPHAPPEAAAQPEPGPDLVPPPLPAGPSRPIPAAGTSGSLAWPDTPGSTFRAARKATAVSARPTAMAALAMPAASITAAPAATATAPVTATPAPMRGLAATAENPKPRRSSGVPVWALVLVGLALSIAAIPLLRGDAAIMAMPGRSAAQPPAAIVVATHGLNLRAGPGTEHPVIETVRLGQEFPVLAQRSDGWTRIGQGRYLASHLVQPAATTRRLSRRATVQDRGGERHFSLHMQRLEDGQVLGRYVDPYTRAARQLTSEASGEASGSSDRMRFHETDDHGRETGSLTLSGSCIAWLQASRGAAQQGCTASGQWRGPDGHLRPFRF